MEKSLSLVHNQVILRALTSSMQQPRLMLAQILSLVQSGCTLTENMWAVGIRKISIIISYAPVNYVVVSMKTVIVRLKLIIISCVQINKLVKLSTTIKL